MSLLSKLSYRSSVVFGEGRNGGAIRTAAVTFSCNTSLETANMIQLSTLF